MPSRGGRFFEMQISDDPTSLGVKSLRLLQIRIPVGLKSNQYYFRGDFDFLELRFVDHRALAGSGSYSVGMVMLLWLWVSEGEFRIHQLHIPWTKLARIGGVFAVVLYNNF